MFKLFQPYPSGHFWSIYNSQTIRSVVSHIYLHVRELSLHKPVFSSGILKLCYQIDQCCKEGENSVF